jgi:hypothetical protein
VLAKRVLLARNMPKKVAGDLSSLHRDSISCLSGNFESTRTSPRGNVKYRVSDIKAKIDVKPSEAVENDRERTCRNRLMRKSR